MKEHVVNVLPPLKSKWKTSNISLTWTQNFRCKVILKDLSQMYRHRNNVLTFSLSISSFSFCPLSFSLFHSSTASKNIGLNLLEPTTQTKVEIQQLFVVCFNLFQAKLDQTSSKHKLLLTTNTNLFFLFIINIYISSSFLIFIISSHLDNILN